MTRRRWIADSLDEPPAPGTMAFLEGGGALHLVRVLRAEPGMEYEIVTGQRVWLAQITSASEQRVAFRLMEEQQAEESLDLTVLLSVFKFDRLEWAIEKLTELGVARVQPVIARRTEKHLAQASINRVERWRKIAGEAARQSRRTMVPEIDAPQILKAALSRPMESAGSQRIAVRLLLAENEKQSSFGSTLQALPANRHAPIMLAIGPEGGWTVEEEALFQENNWKAVSLGPTILRAETAAIAAVSIAASWFHQQQ